MTQKQKNQPDLRGPGEQVSPDLNLNQEQIRQEKRREQSESIIGDRLFG
jgi:hypothetical protein